MVSFRYLKIDTVYTVDGRIQGKNERKSKRETSEIEKNGQSSIGSKKIDLCGTVTMR